MAYWIDRAFWALLVGVCGYATTQMQDLNRAISELNRSVVSISEKLAIVITSQQAQSKTIDKHEERIERLERGEF